MFTKNVFTQTDVVADLIKGINEADYKAKMEALKGNQHKIDKNKNNKIDAHDFKILRGEKKVNEEEIEEDSSVKIPTSTGTRVLGHRYGNAAKTHRDSLADPFAVVRGPGQKDIDALEKKKVKKEEIDPNVTTTDTLTGKVAGKSANPFLKAKVKLNVNEEELDEAMNDDLHPAGAALLKHIKPEHHNLYKPHLTQGTFNGSFSDKHAVLTAAKQAGHLNEETKKEDPPFDGPYKKPGTKPGHGDASRVKHLAKMAIPKTTKEEAELDEANKESEKDFQDRQKRLAAAGAQTAKDPARLKRMMSIPGYSAAMGLANKTTTKEEVEELDELSKSTLGSYAKKASRDAVITRKIGADFENQAKKARSPGMKAASDEISQKYKEKSWKRRDGIDKAVDRLTKEEVEMNERELSPGETAEKERIVKGMKKSLKGFKARYGKDAKSVMYATATKQAKKD